MFLVEKTPAENTTIGVDLSGLREIIGGETVASAVVTATGDVVESYAIDDHRVRIRLRGGVAGTDYRIVLTATTSAGHVREIACVLSVRRK